MIRTLEKTMVLIIFLYLDWFQYVFGMHQIILYAAALLLAGLMCLETIEQRIIVVSNIPFIVKTYIAFGVYAFVTGVLVANEKVFMATSLLQYAEYTFICYAIYHISKEEQDMRWFLGVVFLSAGFAALQTVFFGQYVPSSGVYVITMGRSNNPNVLGLIMVFGLMTVLFDYRLIQKHFTRMLIALVVFLYVTLLTGSRKSFIAAAMVMGGWVINYGIYTRKCGYRLQKKGWKGFLQNFAIVMGVLFAMVYLTSSTFSQSSMLARLLRFFTGGDSANNERVELYKAAFQYFYEHPILGIGFRQYELISEFGMYSHSTYAEILSCNGVIGTILFFTPWVWLTVKVLRRAFAKTNPDSYLYRQILVMLMVELLVAATQIVIYDLGHMTMWTFMFWEFEKAERISKLRGKASQSRLQMPRLTVRRGVRA